MKLLFSKLTAFLKSKPRGIEYTWGKMILWLVIAVVFFGAVSLLGAIE